MIEKFRIVFGFYFIIPFFFNFIPFIFLFFHPIVSVLLLIENLFCIIFEVIIYVWIKYEIWEDKTKEIYFFLGLIENCDIGLKGSDFSNKK